MEKTITATAEATATSALYDHVNCAEEEKKLKQKTEDFVGEFEAQIKLSRTLLLSPTASRRSD